MERSSDDTSPERCVGDGSGSSDRGSAGSESVAPQQQSKSVTTVTDDSTNAPAMSRLSAPLACALLTISLVAAFPAVAWFGYGRHGSNGIAAAAVAAAVVWFGATAALLLVSFFRGSSEQMVSATLLGMLFRTGLPLVTGLAMNRTGGPLAEAGLFGMILIFYLVGLLVETLLSVRLLGSSQRVAKAS